MSRRERITVDEIAGFFDDLAQDYLDPFNWNPNPKLPHAQQKTYTIKEFFIATYHGRPCVYYKDELEICKINFHEIFSGNLIYLAQIDDLQDRIKKIVNADNFYIKATLNSNNNNFHTIAGNMSNTNRNVVDNLDKFGGFKGELDSSQLPTGLENTRRLIETKQIIESSNEKIYGYLIPSKYVTHNVNIDKRDDTTVNTFMGNNTSVNTGSGNRFSTQQRGSIGMQELQVLGVRIRRLCAEFIEQFNPLFHNL